jgi:hypothetical protein
MRPSVAAGDRTSRLRPGWTRISPGSERLSRTTSCFQPSGGLLGGTTEDRPPGQGVIGLAGWEMAALESIQQSQARPSRTAPVGDKPRGICRRELARGVGSTWGAGVVAAGTARRRSQVGRGGESGEVGLFAGDGDRAHGEVEWPSRGEIRIGLGRLLRAGSRATCLCHGERANCLQMLALRADAMQVREWERCRSRSLGPALVRLYFPGLFAQIS